MGVPETPLGATSLWTGTTGGLLVVFWVESIKWPITDSDKCQRREVCNLQIQIVLIGTLSFGN